MINVKLTSLAAMLSSLCLGVSGASAVSAQSSTPPAMTKGESEQIALAQQINWESNATDLRGRLDQDFSFSCPPSGRVGTIWGTDLYTDDSSICSAAVHAGLITARDGGTVTIRIRPGAASYIGTNRNGVRSSDYGSWDGSYIFLNGSGATLSPQPAISSIGWDANATDYRGRLDQDFVFGCPPNGRVGRVWGTDLYTDDSSICSAAVHAGLITARNGGTVTIRIRPGADSYAGTTRNGVSTTSYGSWYGSFVFLR